MKLKIITVCTLLVLFCSCMNEKFTLHTYAVKEDGREESFIAHPIDFHYVYPDVFYVVSPSGEIVYHSCVPYYHMNLAGDRVLFDPYLKRPITLEDPPN